MWCNSAMIGSWLVLVGCVLGNALRPLNQYVEHYEPLTYEPITSDQSWVHSRPKRSPQPIAIDFKAHGKHFPLRLRPDSDSVFHKDLVIEASDGRPIAVSLDHIVSGQLATEPRSQVVGHLRDGVFEGQIRTQNDDTYYVERAHHYFNSSDYQLKHNKSLPFHSLIYSSKHVTDPYRHKRSTIGKMASAKVG